VLISVFAPNFNYKIYNYLSNKQTILLTCTHLTNLVFSSSEN
jgi:hypothetical protein